MENIFWFSVFLIFYAYFGYPLLLMTFSAFRHRSVRKGDSPFSVSLIITAYNEEKHIREKIENTLKQDYPRHYLEIIVASDCSSDRTDEFVRSYDAAGVRLVRAPHRKGKEAAQRLAVNVACGEILLFSDAATILPPDAITNIVKSFHDPTVGCVSSVDRIIEPSGAISEEGPYLRYEMFLRHRETKIGSIVGLSGSFFAARREVCQDWAVGLQSDFNTLLNAIKMGLRGVSDPSSIAYYKDLIAPARQFERKVRTILRGMSVLSSSLPLLNPFRYGLFSWQLFSHKICRWLVPFAMISALLTNVPLALHSSFYLSLLSIQLIFYGGAVTSLLVRSLSKNPIFRIPSFFVLVNLSILSAWYHFICGHRIISWTPSER